MLKQALITYFKAFRYSNFKKINRHSNLILAVFFLVFWPPILQLINGGTSLYLMSIPLTPIVLITYGEMLMKFTILKEFFLVPMEQKERKKYVNTLLGIKILIPVAIGILLLFLWREMFDRTWIEVVVLTFVYFSTGIGVSIKRNMTKFTGLNSTNLIIDTLAFVLMVAMESYDYEIWGPEILVILAVEVGLLMILDALILARQYKNCVENICNYEKMFQISGKVENV